MKRLVGLTLLLAFIAGVLLLAPASGTGSIGLSMAQNKVIANYPMPLIRRGQHRPYTRRYYQRHHRRHHRFMGGNG